MQSIKKKQYRIDNYEKVRARERANEQLESTKKRQNEKQKKMLDSLDKSKTINWLIKK